MLHRIAFVIRHLAAAALICGLALHAATAGAVLVTFDDLNLSANDPIPDGYQGINWTTTPVLVDFRWFPSASVDPIHPSPTPPGTAYAHNAFGDVSASFRFLTPEIFNGSYIYAIADTCGASCPTHKPLTVKFDLYLGGVLKHESSTLNGNSDWQFLASGYSGLVDEVVIVKSSIQFAAFMDNISYSEPVPEPAIWALLFPGFLLVGLAACQRRTTWRRRGD
jgi:hypothetical protein